MYVQKGDQVTGIHIPFLCGVQPHLQPLHIHAVILCISFCVLYCSALQFSYFYISLMFRGGADCVPRCRHKVASYPYP